MKNNFLCALHLLFELVHATPFNIDGSLLAKTTKQSNDPCTYDSPDGHKVPGTWQKIGACPRNKVSIDFYYPDG